MRLPSSCIRKGSSIQRLLSLPVVALKRCTWFGFSCLPYWLTWRFAKSQSSCLSFGSLLAKQLCIVVIRHLSIWLPVLRQSAHHFGGLKGCESSGIVCVSLLSGALLKALNIDAQAFNQGSSACKVSK
jgi:hypothetical protein